MAEENGSSGTVEAPTNTEDVASNSSVAPTELQAKIIKQIEFYFGDINLFRDKFLQEQIKADENGWVPLETMIKFKRLAALSTDFDAITAALKLSTSGLMEVNEDNKKIRRSPDKPVPEDTKDRKDDLLQRTVYAKGFPADATLDQCSELFVAYGPVEYVQMRKDIKKAFKGSCFATYATMDGSKAFLEADCVKFKDTELLRYSKEAYFKSKMEEKKQKKESEVKAKEEELKRREEEEKQKFLAKITKGAILDLQKLDSGTKREHIKDAFDEHCKVAWVDFEPGDTQARVRFEKEDGAQVAWNKVKEAGEGTVKINDVEVEGKVLEGDEEVEHWKTVFKAQREKQDRYKKKGGRQGRGGGGRGGGGRGGYRGQGRRKQGRAKEEDSDEEDSVSDAAGNKRKMEALEEPPAAKQPKVETEAD